MAFGDGEFEKTLVGNIILFRLDWAETGACEPIVKGRPGDPLVPVVPLAIVFRTVALRFPASRGG